MEVQRVDWDSDFFNFEVGRVLVQHEVNLAEIDKVVPFRLIYILAKQDIKRDVSLAGCFEDIKLKFAVNMADIETDISKLTNTRDGSPVISNAKSWQNEFMELSYTAGQFSRFCLDPGFKNDEFKKLYRIWIQRSFDKIIADEVLCVYEADKPVALATYKIDGKTLKLGLVSVDVNSQGKGYGKALIHHIFRLAKQYNLEWIEVETQARNINAIKFYEALGMRLVDKTYIYHKWK